MHKLSEVCEQIAATTKKLEKEKILSEYLIPLSDEDLSTACVFLSGTPFPLRDQRTTNTGYALLRDALGDVVPDRMDQLGSVLLRSGDLGTAVEELFQGKNFCSNPHIKRRLLLF